jgi:hypothetical protein
MTRSLPQVRETAAHVPPADYRDSHLLASVIDGLLDV